jgi:hypothetical protein
MLISRIISRFTVTAALVAVGVLATAGLPAVAAPTTTAGAQGIPSAAVAVGVPSQVQLVPAFDHSLPVGTTSIGSGAAQPGALTSATATASWVCTIYASDPWFTPPEIEGDGWQSCTGAGYSPTHIKVTIQAYMGLGLWNARYSYTSPWTSSNWDQATVYYNCTGHGRYTYRIVTDGWAQGGLYHSAVQSLNYLQVTC